MTQPSSQPDGDKNDDAEAARYLLSAHAVRDSALALLRLGLEGRLKHFSVDLTKLETVADFVLQVTQEAYPDGQIPFHARWRHLDAGNVDRWGRIAAARQWNTKEDFGRAAFDLTIISVLLDAGAGADWRYADELTGQTFSRSEGLAVASIDLFASGRLSSVPADPFRVDAEALISLSDEELAQSFQVSSDNPLDGLEGRANLLRALGNHIVSDPEIFAREDDPRPGGLFDFIRSDSDDESVKASFILERVLEGLGPIWPSRLELAGVSLGDTWRYEALKRDNPASGLIPFHKLSQWLTYSLIEPLTWCDVTVSDFDGLTGLAEYRNGGLLLDAGLIRLNDEADREKSWALDSELIIEWRALTVALLDLVAARIREITGLSTDEFPLACVLQGGTWSAGRRLAYQLREGKPPIVIESDGTVF